MFAQKNKPENKNYEKNQASKNSSVSKKHKEGFNLSIQKKFQT